MAKTTEKTQQVDPSKSTNGGANPYANGVTAVNGPAITDIPASLWDFLTSKGLGSVTVAAMMGNICLESGGFDTAAISGDGYGSLGLCQWTNERRTRLEDMASSLGRPATDPAVQFDYLWWELTNRYPAVIGDMQAQGDNIEAQTETFCWEFENPALEYAHLDRRIEYAKEIFASQGKGITTAGTYKATGAGAPGFAKFGTQAAAVGVKTVSTTEHTITMKKLPGKCFAEPVYPDFITVSDTVPAWVLDLDARQREVTAKANANGVNPDGTPRATTTAEKTVSAAKEVLEDVAPNGTHYEKNDYDYLKEQNPSLSKEEILRILSQDEKYIKREQEASGATGANSNGSSSTSDASNTSTSDSSDTSPYIKDEGSPVPEVPASQTNPMIAENVQVDQRGRQGISFSKIDPIRKTQIDTQLSQKYPAYQQSITLTLAKLDRISDTEKEKMRQLLVNDSFGSDEQAQVARELYRLYFEAFDTYHTTQMVYS